MTTKSFRRPSAVLAAALLAALLVPVLTATRAEAAVMATVSGTVLTVSITGDHSLTVSCDGNSHVTVDGSVTSPLLACSAMTSVHLTGDDGAQTFYANYLNSPQFSAHPYLTASMGGGADTLSETNQTDTIDMGAGVDRLSLYSGGDVNLVQMGADYDTVWVFGTDLPDTMTMTSTNANAKVVVTNSGGTTTSAALAVEVFDAYGNGGDDTMDASGVTAASSVYPTLSGGAGNDTLTGSAHDDDLSGSEGTNVYHGGTGQDQVHTESQTDVIHLAGGGKDEVFDEHNGRSGGRTIDGELSSQYADFLQGCDDQTRIR